MRPKVCALATTPRSGTHFLRFALDNHPHMSWAGEFFRDNIKKNIRETRIHSYVYNNLSSTAIDHFKYVGFVWHLILDADLDYSAVDKFILLERKHKLAQFTSLQIAAKTGVWRAPEKNPNHENTEKIEIDVEEYFEFLGKYNSTYDEFKTTAVEYKTVYYEDLCNDFNQTMESIQKFLELDYFKIEPGDLQKQEHRPLEEIILNYEDMKKYDGFYKI